VFMSVCLCAYGSETVGLCHTKKVVEVGFMYTFVQKGREREGKRSTQTHRDTHKYVCVCGVGVCVCVCVFVYVCVW